MKSLEIMVTLLSTNTLSRIYGEVIHSDATVDTQKILDVITDELKDRFDSEIDMWIFLDAVEEEVFPGDYL